MAWTITAEFYFCKPINGAVLCLLFFFSLKFLLKRLLKRNSQKQETEQETHFHIKTLHFMHKAIFSSATINKRRKWSKLTWSNCRHEFSYLIEKIFAHMNYTCENWSTYQFSIELSDFDFSCENFQFVQNFIENSRKKTSK